MNSILAFCLLSVVAVALARPDGDKYTDRYDNVNVKEVLENDQLFEAYFNCLLDKGKCTPDAKELKSHIKEALENECGKCTDPQKDGTRTVIKHLVNEKPGHWKQLTAKYDPEDKFSHKYEKELKEVAA